MTYHPIYMKFEAKIVISSVLVAGKKLGMSFLHNMDTCGRICGDPFN